jgi:hypothetical protein
MSRLNGFIPLERAVEPVGPGNTFPAKKRQSLLNQE